MYRTLSVLCALAAMTASACTTTVIRHESTPVAVTASPPAAPEPEPEPAPEPPPRVTVEAERIRVDEKILFEIGSAEISAASDGLLREIAEVMTANPHVTKIRVEGHTDNQGAAAYNLRLSRQRAEAVMQRMVENGVDSSRLESEGYGLTRPVETNDTNEGRTANRRVEFNILEQQPPAPAPEGQAAPAPAPPEGGGQ